MKRGNLPIVKISPTDKAVMISDIHAVAVLIACQETDLNAVEGKMTDIIERLKLIESEQKGKYE